MCVETSQSAGVAGRDYYQLLRPGDSAAGQLKWPEWCVRLDRATHALLPDLADNAPCRNQPTRSSPD